jgi:hypothetical protein
MGVVEHGESVWFDEWDIRPGESIVGGIEEGITECDVFVIVWSKNAAESKWVGTELRAIVRRRVDVDNLRIVPILIDDTELPSLVADYRGFALNDESNIQEIASEIVGEKLSIDIAQMLQKRLHELADGALSLDNPLRILVCPKCASKNLNVKKDYDGYSDSQVYFAVCMDCDWGEAKKAKEI